MFHVEHFAAFLPRNVPHGTFRAHRSAGRSCPHASPSLPAVPGGAVQDSISARGAARLFCLAYRQMKSVPGAALPPRSAPETNTLATRAKCPDHSVRRRTATRPPPRPGPFALRAGQETVHSLRPVPPHRMRRLGHFPRRRKMSVPMRTTCGGPGFASARWRRTATRPLPRPGPFALRARQETVHSLRPVPPHRTRHLGHFPRRRKVSVLGQTKDGSPWLPGKGQEDRASP